jgi:hypothetical protein
MATKKKATKGTRYAMSRSKIVKALDKLNDRLEEVDVYESSFNDINNVLDDVRSALADLAWQVLEERS